MDSQDVYKMGQIVTVFSQSVAAFARIESMKAKNEERRQAGMEIVYSEQHFDAVSDEFGLGCNTVACIIGG